MLLQGTICFLIHKQQISSVLGNLPCPQRSVVSRCGSRHQHQSFPLSKQEESISYCRDRSVLSTLLQGNLEKFYLWGKSCFSRCAYKLSCMSEVRLSCEIRRGCALGLGHSAQSRYTGLLQVEKKNL